MARLRTKWILLALIGAVLAGALYLALREQPLAVDLGQVDRGPMLLEIESDALTRVAEPYVVSAPVSGLLHRVTLAAGDPVVAGETVLALISPALPAVLDARSRAQAQASLTEAQAALVAGQADRDAAQSASRLARDTYERTQRLLRSGAVSQAAVDSARTAAEAAEARLATAEATITMREAAIASAQSLLHQANGDGAAPIEVIAPATGTVLQVIAQSEGPIAAGTPIMQTGDVAGDLEVVCDILSRDAVRVTAGDRVRISDWGGAGDLDAVVTRVDPMAVTKLSALGVEEQRVNVIIRFTNATPRPAGLGHGFQVDAHIVVWETPDALRIPSSALFRDADGWSAFAQDETGRARRKALRIGVNNGTHAELLGGIEAGERVVLFPTGALSEGALIHQRAAGSEG